MKWRIGVDISGGDFAPSEIFRGAVLASKELEAKIFLIGQEAEIREEANRQKVNIKDFCIVDAKEKIKMEEPAANSVRRKKDSSIVKGIILLRDKEIDAFVSCGNTGAVVCASSLILGLIEGVERPGIGLLLPTTQGVSLMIDVGANVDPKPLHLLQYGVMSTVYYSLVLNKKEPTVGLLNIGEESSKGTELIKQTHRLFSESSLNFIGNLEAKSVFLGKCNCIICDGYVGNIALKISEGLAEAIGKFLINAINKDIKGKLGYLLIRQSIKKFKKLVDYAEYGGAPLLGVRGVVIIGHGRSNAYAVKNAIKVALQELERDVIERIKRRMDEICQDSRLRKIFTSQGFDKF